MKYSQRAIWCGVVLQVLLTVACGQVHSQEVVVLACTVEEGVLKLEYQIMGTPAWLQSAFEFEIRPVSALKAMTLVPLERSMVWAKSGQVQSASFRLPPSAKPQGSSLELSMRASKQRIAPGFIIASSASLGTSLLSRWQSAQHYERYLAATDQSEMDGAFQASQRWHRVSVVSGVSGAGGLGILLLAHREAKGGRWALAPTQVLLNHADPASFVQTIHHDEPCIFQSGDQVPAHGSTLRLSVNESCQRCGTLGVPFGNWQALLSKSYTVVSREELEATVFREQQDIWANGLADGNWDMRLGDFTAAQYSVRVDCSCGNEGGVSVQFIDNETTAVVWTASSHRCSGQQLFELLQFELNR